MQEFNACTVRNGTAYSMQHLIFEVDLALDAMTNTVECHAHGEQEQTFVCQHLLGALRTGEKVGFFSSGGPRGDAWCSACEEFRRREGGSTGDWNERSEAFAGVKLLCGACYDRLRAQHGF